MALPYEMNLACRDLTRHPALTAAMVLGLAVAVLVMVYIPSTMASFYDDMIDRIVEQNSAHITVWPVERKSSVMQEAVRSEYGQDVGLLLIDRTMPRSRNLNGYHALARIVEETGGIEASASFVRANATANVGKTNLGIDLEGIVPNEYGLVVNMAEHFPDKEVPKLGPADIAIGFRAADKLGVHEGDHIKLVTADSQMLMRVRAIFHSGYYDKDLHRAYVLLSTAQRMFQMGNEVSGIAARCDDLDEAVAISSILKTRTGLKIRNWRDDNASLLAEVATVKRVTAFVNALVALVASAGMANVFSVFVMNRQKELAILRAVGGSRGSLKAILMLEAFFIWLVGTIIGSTAVLMVMAYEQLHPFEVSAETYGIASYATSPKAPAFILAVVLAACTMAGSAWWSGRKAARLSPIEVIFGK